MIIRKRWKDGDDKFVECKIMGGLSVKYITNKSKTKNNNFEDFKLTFNYVTNPAKTQKQFLLIESFT